MNTPNIRFKGYNAAWEQRKLGEQMYIKSRIGWQALTRDEYLERGDYYLVTGTDIDEDTHTVDLSRCYYVSKERYEMDDKIQVHEGDIIVTKDGTIGKVAMVSGLDKPATLNSHLFVLRDLSGTLNNRFLLHILNSHVFDSFVESTKTGSTLTGLPQKTFVEFEFFAPKIDEQKLISNFFDNLDNLIALQQRKCDDLQEVKKYMLQKLFPQNGAKIPEIRFEGFTGDWEQRKLNNITDVRDGTHDSPNYVEFGHPFITSKNVKDGYINYDDVQYISDNDFEQINRRSKVDVDDILMGMIGTIGNLALIREEPDFAIKNVALIKHTGGANPFFVYSYLQADNVSKQLGNVLAGGTQNFISLRNIRELDVSIPNMQEQNKIGEYFANLDNLITLHQRKCDDLKEFKKFMLQNMFPEG